MSDGQYQYFYSWPSKETKLTFSGDKWNWIVFNENNEVVGQMEREGDRLVLESRVITCHYDWGMIEYLYPGPGWTIRVVDIAKEPDDDDREND